MARPPGDRAGDLPAALSLLALVGSLVLVHEDVTIDGSLVALATVGALLATVVTVGVAVSAVSNNTPARRAPACGWSCTAAASP